MNPPWSPEVLLWPTEDAQAMLPLGADGVARWVWQSRFGAMLIEVIDGAVFVNGDRVQPHGGSPAPAQPVAGQLPAGERASAVAPPPAAP